MPPPHTSLELFAGAGGLALGLEKAGFSHLGLVELNKDACNTLRLNRPEWPVIETDIKTYFPKNLNIDLLTGGFPCQSFSHAGKRLGLEDVRGTLVYEFIRILNITKPLLFLAENVKGLKNHDNGKTLTIILNLLADAGYTILPFEILNTNHYAVPQKRERLILIGVQKELASYLQHFPVYPSSLPEKLVLADALRKGKLFNCDTPISSFSPYSPKKQAILAKVPAGKNWKSLSLSDQKQYMGKSFFAGGGKTGIARRLAWSDPAPTLTCSPAQMQTERCHPDETRPLTVREYARIQTFPDTWAFSGSLASQYKQIGNAVPVNFAYHLGTHLSQMLQILKSVAKTKHNPQQ